MTTVRLGGGHCCVCSVVCHHIGPVRLCDQHAQRPAPAPAPAPVPAPVAEPVRPRAVIGRPGALAVLARAMSEKTLQDQVFELAMVWGWLRNHARAARTARGWRTPIEGDAGFCDLILAGHGRLIVVELKTEAGRPTSGQVRWLDALAVADGVETYLWRPMDWLTGRIQRVLSYGYDPAASDAVPQWGADHA
jgi:hypothetical protein